MKRLVLLVCLSLSWTLTLAQTKTFPIDSASKKITFTEKIELAGTSKDELYKRAKNLGVLGNNTVKDDPANGTYTYKGQFKVSYPAPQVGMQHTGVVDYKVTIQVKDGKYRYIITDFVHSSEKANGGKLESNLPECGKYTLTMAGWGSIKRSVMEQTDKFIAGLKSRMAGGDGTSMPPGNDW